MVSWIAFFTSLDFKPNAQFININVSNSSSWLYKHWNLETVNWYVQSVFSASGAAVAASSCRNIYWVRRSHGIWIIWPGDSKPPSGIKLYPSSRFGNTDLSVAMLAVVSPGLTVYAGQQSGGGPAVRVRFVGGKKGFIDRWNFHIDKSKCIRFVLWGQKHSKEIDWWFMGCMYPLVSAAGVGKIWKPKLQKSRGRNQNRSPEALNRWTVAHLHDHTLSFMKPDTTAVWSCCCRNRIKSNLRHSNKTVCKQLVGTTNCIALHEVL